MTRRDVIQAVSLFVVVAAFLLGTAYLNARETARSREITCTSARANIEQLAALREIADQLGVPVQFPIPEIPPECDGA